MTLHRALVLVAGATFFLTTQVSANPKSDDPCEQGCLALLKSCEKLCSDPATKNDDICETPCLQQTEECEKQCPKLIARSKSGSLDQGKIKLKRPANDGFEPAVIIDK